VADTVGVGRPVLKPVPLVELAEEAEGATEGVALPTCIKKRLSAPLYFFQVSWLAQMHGVMLAGEENQGFGGRSQSPPYPQGRR